MEKHNMTNTTGMREYPKIMPVLGKADIKISRVNDPNHLSNVTRNQPNISHWPFVHGVCLARYDSIRMYLGNYTQKRLGNITVVLVVI